MNYLIIAFIVLDEGKFNMWVTVALKCRTQGVCGKKNPWWPDSDLSDTQIVFATMANGL